MFSILIHAEGSTAPLLRKANIWRVELSSNTALIKMGNETVWSEVFTCLSLVGFSWNLWTWISTVCSATGTCTYPEHEKHVGSVDGLILCDPAVPVALTTVPLLRQESWLPTLGRGSSTDFSDPERERCYSWCHVFSSTADGIVGLICLTL